MNNRILKLVPIPLLIATVALFAGCKKHNAYVPPTPGPGGAIASAEKNSFDQVTGKLDKGGSFYLYLSTEQALSSLSKNIANYSNVFTQMPATPAMGREGIARIFEVIGNLVKDSGIEHISGVGASSIAREKGFYFNKLIVHHYDGDSDGLMWSAFGKEAHPLKELDLLPENTAFAAYGDLDIPLLWKTIQKELKQLHLPEVDKALAEFPDKFKAGAGISFDDVLNSLGGGYGFIFTLDESQQITLPIPASPMQIPEPGLAIFARVKNDAIYTRIDQLMIGNPAVVKTQLGGVKTISLAIPLPLPIHLRPTLARSGDYLFLTSSDNLLQDIMAVQSGKKSGYKSTAEFKKLSQGVPDQGNNFSLISAKFGKSLTHAMQGAMSAQAGEMGALSKVMQDMMNSNAVTFAYSVGANGAEGWEAFSNGNKSAGAMLLPAAAGGVAVVAAMLLPALAKAKAKAQEINCINNLRQIEIAKKMWANDNNKKDADTPTEQDLSSYLGRGPNSQFLVCPQGGTYIIGSVGEKPRCSIPGHVLP